jgi:hypothetical protein
MAMTVDPKAAVRLLEGYANSRAKQGSAIP